MLLHIKQIIMKTINTFITAIFTLLIITSCENDSKIAVSEIDYVSFETTSSEILVAPDGTASQEIKIFTSSKVTADKTYALNVVTNLTTASTSAYTIPSTVTIPSGTNVGVITVTVDGSNIDSSGSDDLVIEFTDADNLYRGEALTITLQQFCETPPTTFFTGRYLIEQTTPEVDGPTLSTGQIVDVILEPTDSTTLIRKFLTQNYNLYCTGYNYFYVDLSCNKITVLDQDSSCGCSDATDWFGAATVSSTYDVAQGDDVLYVSFTDDQYSDCGTPTTTTYKFTKQ
jgi:hypothetical protein